MAFSGHRWIKINAHSIFTGEKRVAPRSHAWARMVTLFTPRQNQLLLSSNVFHFSPRFRSKYLGKKFKHESSSDATTFIDTEGHFMNLGHTEPSWFVHQLLELLKAEKDDSIEIGELDRGNLYFTLQKHPSGKWVVSQTRINLYGWVGTFTDYVMQCTHELLRPRYDSRARDARIDFVRMDVVSRLWDFCLHEDTKKIRWASGCEAKTGFWRINGTGFPMKSSSTEHLCQLLASG
ncbi:hypothetical protein B0H11DRAFT_1924722 [Mycena galericulata]|nr:hypothetical protein B0H11DRAFT_1924722 [Mycena galericulata]